MKTKEQRRKEIGLELTNIVAEREILNTRKHKLMTELEYIRGHYDETWEEHYGGKNE